MMMRETTAAVLFVAATMLGTCAVFNDDPVTVYSERSSSQHDLDEALSDVEEAVQDLKKALRDPES